VSPTAVRRRPAHRARRRAPDEKREQIAAAAARLFARHGYAGTTTARIADRAGVSEGIVFHHFRTKRELFHRVVADYGRDFVSAMFGDDPGAQPRSPRSAIEAGFAFVREHADLHRVFATRDPDLAALVHAGTHDPIVAALEQTLAAGVAQGRARRMNTRIVAELCYSLVEGALQACFIEGDGSGEAEYLAEAIHCVESATQPISKSNRSSR
jgi:AcrR family transcriptional regulator